MAHVFATNKESATNNATNARADEAAPEDVSRKVAVAVPGLVGERNTVDQGGGSVVVRTKNRRTREAYNAYQREYMRKWRQRS